MQNDLQRLGDSSGQVCLYTDTLFLSRFLFLSLVAHGKHLKTMEPLLQSQLGEAGRAREERPATSRLVEGMRKLVFGRHQRYPPLPRPLCIPDGAADQPCGGPGPVHKGARQRHGHGLQFTFEEDGGYEERPCRARLRPGKDRGEEESVDHAAYLGMAGRFFEGAREGLLVRTVRRPLRPTSSWSRYDSNCALCPISVERPLNFVKRRLVGPVECTPP